MQRTCTFSQYTRYHDVSSFKTSEINAHILFAKRKCNRITTKLHRQEICFGQKQQLQINNIMPISHQNGKRIMRKFVRPLRSHVQYKVLVTHMCSAAKDGVCVLKNNLCNTHRILVCNMMKHCTLTSSAKRPTPVGDPFFRFRPRLFSL
jgi:hypothetical protein